MTEANYSVGQSFRVQFVWRLPDQDYLRAVFNAKVLRLDEISDKYVLELGELVAGRQESPAGEMRSRSELAGEYWARVLRLPGRKIALAFEADDGRPLWLRLETLTGEHNFFNRLNEVPQALLDIFERRRSEGSDGAGS
jgi:hypothetical protein